MANEGPTYITMHSLAGTVINSMLHVHMTNSAKYVYICDCLKILIKLSWTWLCIRRHSDSLLLHVAVCLAAMSLLLQMF